MNKLFTLLVILIFCTGAFSQNIRQTIRGQVIDKESRYPLAGVSIRLLSDSSGAVGCATDEGGHFILPNVQVGKHSLEFRYLGYSTRVLSSLQLSSAKELVLTVEMEESALVSEDIIIQGKKNPSDAQNEMATVSARSFTVEETDRFAGSRGDPSRMASNFAGVQGANDSRNDIVIRGNSPAGVLWRVDGVDIPNPNHFSIPGTTGGPVNIINNKMLANSDFFTGAFPAEFGNATAGVFDLRLRNGNNQKYEHSFQFGFLGTELFSEGPISKKRGSSYLLGYRYSSLALFDALNFDIGTNAVPKYQDGGFKLNFPLKNNASLSVWGFGGFSSIDILISRQKPEERNIYGESDRDQYFTSIMGVLGLTYTKSLSSSTFLKWTASASNQSVIVHHDYLFYNTNRDTLFRKDLLLQYTFATTTWNTHFTVNHKINKALTLKAGILLDVIKYRYEDSARAVQADLSGNVTLLPFEVRWMTNTYAALVRPYVQAKYKMGTRLSLNAGLHAQYYSLSQSVSWLEPRLGARYELSTKSSLNLGLGIHSQTQSPYLYFFRGNTQREYNRNMDFTRSFHSMLGYTTAIGKSTSLKVETYYQYLYHIPVSDTATSFSLINTGSGFTRFFPGQLVNKGIGRNFGVEATLEHFFAKKYYLLVTASLFDAKYMGSDGIWRNTDFNGRYAVNALFTREWKIRKNSALQIGAKFTTVGGRYYSPADTALSNQRSELIERDKEKNTLQTPAYIRYDLRVSYKWNRPRVSHEFALDLVNVFNHKNVLSLTYAPDGTGNNIRFEYQLSRLPLFYYRLDF